MYRLTKTSPELMNNFLMNNFLENNDMKLTCVVMNVLKIVLIIYILHWIYKKFISKYEHFDVSKPILDGKTSLHDLLTADCKSEYCNALGWSTDKTKIPDGYSLANLSTVDGCCVIPNKLLDYINVSGGGNKEKMDNVNNDLKMNSYIRD